MSGDGRKEREERALEALLVSALRSDALVEEVSPDHLPTLTEEEREAMAALGETFVARLLKGEPPLRPRTGEKQSQRAAQRPAARKRPKRAAASAPGLRLSDFLVREAIVADLSADSTEAVIRTMVESLRGAGRLREADLEGVVGAIVEREPPSVACIGYGVAVACAMHSSIDQPIGTVAVSQSGVCGEDLAAEPVHIFVLLISPQDRPGDHLRALEKLSRCLHDDAFVRSLRNAASREEISALLDRIDGLPQRMDTPHRRTVLLANPKGLSMRPSCAFAERAGCFQSNITVIVEGRSANGKSVWDVLALAVMPGSEVTVTAEGPDAQQAIDALAALLAAPTADE